MSWLQRYKLRHYIHNPIWILPVSGMLAALVAVNVLDWIEKRVGWPSSFDVDATRTLFSILAGSLLTFSVFLSSSLLLVVQLASAQLTPRIIGIVFRDPVVMIFIATITAVLLTNGGRSAWFVGVFLIMVY